MNSDVYLVCFRYDHEQVSRQEAEGRAEQLMKKMEFNDQVHSQQGADYQVCQSKEKLKSLLN